MIRRFTAAAAVALAALAFTCSIPPAHAAPGDYVFTYDTVDALDTSGDFTVTGVLAGSSVATTTSFDNFGSSSTWYAAEARCERFALLAMSKPGKYQFTITVPSAFHFTSCKLSLRTP
jgi:hypothetical protein